MVIKKAFPLRISEDIWEAVRRWSDDELRSVNSQIEYVLRDALRKAGRLPHSADKKTKTTTDKKNPLHQE
jgi:hypothetical protein